VQMSKQICARSGQNREGVSERSGTNSYEGHSRQKCTYVWGSVDEKRAPFATGRRNNNHWNDGGPEVRPGRFIFEGSWAVCMNGATGGEFATGTTGDWKTQSRGIIAVPSIATTFHACQ